MTKQLPDLERRRVATAKTLAKYRDKPFDWRRSATCIHLARFHMRAMGHRPPRMPAIRSALRAKRELAKRECESVIALLDSIGLERIAPAQMRLGDLAAVPGVEGLDAVFVNITTRKFAGWREDQHGLVALDLGLDEVTAAWRL